MLGQIEKVTCVKFGVCRAIFVCFIAKNECDRHYKSGFSITYRSDVSKDRVLVHERH